MTARQHHPRTETLAAYAAGHLFEASSVLIATHLETCAQCQRAVRDLEALGGVALEAAPEEALAPGTLERFWQTAGEREAAAHEPIETPPEIARGLEAAAPLAAYLGEAGLDGVRWRAVAPGVSQAILAAHGYRKGALRLLRIAPGIGVPLHTHGGNELTLVLKGAYVDELGLWGVGDVADLDGKTRHSPLADGDEPCVCLIATDAPLRFTDLASRLIQPFVGL